MILIGKSWSAVIQSYQATLSSYQILQTANYSLAFTTVNAIPLNGMLQVVFPEAIQATTNAFCSLSYPAGNISCNFSEVMVNGSMSNSVPAYGAVSFSINGLINPSPAEQLSFTLNTLSPAKTVIDSFTFNVTYQPVLLAAVSISPSSGKSGVLANWTISAQISIQVPSDGLFTLYLPKWNINLNPPVYRTFNTSSSYCDSSCSFSNDILTIFPSSSVSSTWTYTVYNMKNPPSTQPVAGFVLNTYSSVGQLQTSQGTTLQVSTVYSGDLTSTSLNSSVSKVNSISQYTFAFNTSNPLISSSFIFIQFPASVTLQVSQVTPAIGFDYSGPLQVNLSVSQINLTQIVASYKETQFFQFTVISCVNPPSTQPVYISATIGYSNFITDSFQGFQVFAAPGSISVNSITPLANTVNTVTQYAFNFYSTEPIKAGFAISIVFPIEIQLGSQGGCYGVAGISQSAYCAAGNGVFNITNAFPADFGTGPVQFNVGNVGNPISTKPSSSFLISIYSASNFLYLVSQNSTANIQVAPGTLSGFVNSQSYITGDTTSYMINLTITDAIPTGGYITMQFPPEIGAASAQISGFSGFGPTVLFLFPSSSQLNITNGFNSASFAGTLSLTISNLRNPQSQKPSSSFQISSFSSGYVIDLATAGFSLTMNSTHGLSSMNVSAQTSVVGTSSLYFFSLTPFNPIPNGGVLLVNPPEEVVFNSKITCTAVSGVISVSCSVVNGGLQIVLAFNSQSSLQPLVVSAGNIVNPNSTRSVSFQFITTDGVYPIDSSESLFAASVPGQFQSLSISCTSFYISSPASCTIQYASSVPLSASSYFQISLGYLSSNTMCLLNSQSISCTLSGALTLKGTFSSIGNITLLNLVNPSLAGNYLMQISSATSDGYLIDSSNASILITCQSPCLTCAGSASTCLSCNASSLFPYLYNGNCNSACATGFYAAVNFTCEPCNSSCFTCSNSPSSCTSCSTGYLSAGSCISSCPSSAFPVGNVCSPCILPCKTCQSSSNCSSCVSPYSLYISSCVANCPSLTTVSVSGVCQSCQDCLTCQTNPSTCLSCTSGLYLYNFSCIANCPNGTFTNSGVCQPCSSSCKTCSGNQYNCLSCYDGNYIMGTACVSQCSPGFYYNNSACMSCSSPCANCSVTGCTSCQANFYIESNQCVQQCDPGFFFSNNLCESCPNTCSKCITSTLCTGCSTGYFLYQSSCFNTCPQGTFNSSGTCINCQDCPVCDSNKGCLYCTSGSYFNGTCIENCPIGYVEVQAICVSCENCEECYGVPSNCTKCKEGKNLYDNICVNYCPQGYVAVNQTCVVNTTGECSPGCTESMLNNTICDALCNTKSCNYDNLYCSSDDNMNSSYSGTFDIKQDPFVITGLAGCASAVVSGLAVFTSSSFLLTISPVLSGFESIGKMTVLTTVACASDFKGRKLSDEEEKLNVFIGCLVALFVVHYLFNCTFNALYWFEIRKKDHLHELWSFEHKWGTFFVMAFAQVFSFKVFLLFLSKIPKIQICSARFDSEQRLLKLIMFIEAFHIFLVALPLLALYAVILLTFSWGSITFNLTLDTIAITGLDLIVSVVLLISFRFSKDPTLKYRENHTVEVSNTVEFTESAHEHSKKQEISVNLNNELQEIDENINEPSSEEPVPPSPEIVSQLRVHKNPAPKRENFSFGLSQLFPRIITDEDQLDFRDCEIDLEDPYKVYARIKGFPSKVPIYKDFYPSIVINDDEEIVDIQINYADYELISVSPKNPKIGEFEHKDFHTRIRLMRNFAGAVVVGSYKENARDLESEQTVRVEYKAERPVYEWDLSEGTPASDSLKSLRSTRQGFGLSSSKLMLRSGSPPKVLLSRILAPHPGLSESSVDSHDC